MKRLILSGFARASIIFCVFSLNAFSGVQKTHMDNEFYLQYNDITESEKGVSSLTEGLKYYDMFNWYINGQKGDYKYKFNLGLKATDDSRKDIKDLSLTNIQGSVSNKIHTVKVGDVFDFFSQYSLNTALKGVSYKYLGNGSNNQLQFDYGVDYPRWDNFFDNTTKAVKRNVYATRYIRKSPQGLLTTGLSFVYSNDEDRVFSNTPLYDNYLYTIDANYRPIPNLNIYSEFSHSSSTKNSGDNAVEVSDSGSAFKIRAIGNKNPSRVLLEYERVSPDFITLTGSATPDREKFKSTWRFKVSKKITTHLGLLWYRNNLNKQLISEKHVYRPSFGITYKKAFGRKYNVLNITYKLDKTNATNDVLNHILDLSMNDRFGKIYNTTNLSYYNFKTDTAIQKSHEFRVNTQFSGRVPKEGYVLKPSLNLGTWSNNNELQNTLDKYYDASLGLGIDIPGYKISSKLKIGNKKAIRESSDDSKKLFASLNVYYRPKKFLFFKRTVIYLKAFINDFTYTTNSNDFRENSITTGIKTRF